MKIVCIGLIVCLCLALSLAWPGSYNQGEDNDKREIVNKFLQYLAAPNGKYNNSISLATSMLLYYQCSYGCNWQLLFYQFSVSRGLYSERPFLGRMLPLYSRTIIQTKRW